ncbi:MAG TPA: hypothetical protein DF984_04105 [Anaerolineaceae bacterium]|jgi:uncharacterized protein (TIGR00369 family)|nr:hypothetical protein [Anaerolineaceae bacterium]
MKEKQPGSKQCFVCGLENPVGLRIAFYETGPGEVQSEIIFPDHYQGYPGITHGGIIASVLDETGGRSLMDNPRHFMVTAQLNVRYRKPVPTETPLVAKGWAGKRQGRVSEARSEIQNLAGEVLAEAKLVLVDMPEGKFDQISFEEMGWRVYPDEEEK